MEATVTKLSTKIELKFSIHDDTKRRLGGEQWRESFRNRLLSPYPDMGVEITKRGADASAEGVTYLIAFKGRTITINDFMIRLEMVLEGQKWHMHNFSCDEVKVIKGETP